MTLLALLSPSVAGAQYWDGRGYRDAPPPPANYGRASYPPRAYPGSPPGSYGDRGSSPARYRQRCNRGGGGAIIGAIAGGLLGNAVAGRGDRGFGTILGAGAGALTGREIERNC